LEHEKATFDNTPGLRRALHIVHADHASLYGVYILDVRYAFAGVDGYVSRAASELARHFSTRHVHVLENDDDDSTPESFLGVYFLEGRRGAVVLRGVLPRQPNQTATLALSSSS
jgi:hypothetical protein